MPQDALTQLIEEQKKKKGKVTSGSVDLGPEARNVPAGDALTQLIAEQKSFHGKDKVIPYKPPVRRYEGVFDPILEGLVDPRTIEAGANKIGYALGDTDINEMRAQRAQLYAKVQTGRGTEQDRADLEAVDFRIMNIEKLSGTTSDIATSPLSIATLGAGSYLKGIPALVAAAPFAMAGGKAVLTPQQEGESEADVLERRLGGGAQVLMSAPGLRPSEFRAAGRQFRAMPEQARLASQKALGAGPESTYKAIGERQRTIAEQEAGHKQATFEKLLERGTVAEQNAAARARVAAENAGRWQGKQQEYQQKVTEHRSIQELAASLEARHNVESMALRDAVRAKETALREDFKARYDTIRDAVGDAPVEAVRTVEAVQHAESKILQGSTENIRIFRELMNASGAAELAQASVFRGQGGVTLRDLPPQVRAQVEAQLGSEISKPLGSELKFADAQGFYSELGMKLSGGNLPGDVYRAVKHVRDAVGQDLQFSTDKAGVGGSYRLTQSDWHRFMDTFHNMDALSKGGSPVARIFRAEDPAFAREPVTGKAAARAERMLSDYSIDPAMGRRLLADARQLKVLQAAAQAKPPKPPTRLDKPLPEGKALPEGPLKPERPPKIDPEALKRELLSKKAGRLRGESTFLEDSILAGATGITGALLYGKWAMLHALYPFLRSGARRTAARLIESQSERLSKTTRSEREAAKNQP